VAQSVVRTVLLNWGEVGSGWNVVVFVIVLSDHFPFFGKTEEEEDP